MASISSEVATGRSMNAREGFIRQPGSNSRGKRPVAPTARRVQSPASKLLLRHRGALGVCPRNGHRLTRAFTYALGDNYLAAVAQLIDSVDDDLIIRCE